MNNVEGWNTVLALTEELRRVAVVQGGRLPLKVSVPAATLWALCDGIVNLASTVLVEDKT